MFDDPTPEELTYFRFRKAALEGDAPQVRQILAEHPEAANQTHRMPSTVLQALAMEMFSFQCKPGHIECMVAIVQAGGDLTKHYNYTASPVNILLRRGVLPALRALHERGLLAGAVGGQTSEDLPSIPYRDPALAFICTTSQWRDTDRNYPIAELVQLLIDAGAPPYTLEIDSDGQEIVRQSAVEQMLRSLDSPVVRPDGCARAMEMLLSVDQRTQFGAALVMLAWRSKDDDIFKQVVRRYFDQGGDHAGLQEIVRKSRIKAANIANFQAGVLDALAPSARLTQNKSAPRRI